MREGIQVVRVAREGSPRGKASTFGIRIPYVESSNPTNNPRTIHPAPNAKYAATP